MIENIDKMHNIIYIDIKRKIKKTNENKKERKAACLQEKRNETWTQKCESGDVKKLAAVSYGCTRYFVFSDYELSAYGISDNCF